MQPTTKSTVASPREELFEMDNLGSFSKPMTVETFWIYEEPQPPVILITPLKIHHKRVKTFWIPEPEKISYEIVNQE